jgi:hypothetical protein
MQRYSQFRPTQFDSHINITDQEDWYVVPVARNRDSKVWEESNFEVALKMLGGESETVQVHRFGHWTNGWFEIILVKPESKAFDVALEIEGSLEDDPYLDEYNVYEREHEEAQEVWKNCFNNAKRIAYIRNNRIEFSFDGFADLLGCARGKFFNGCCSSLLGE